MSTQKIKKFPEPPLTYHINPNEIYNQISTFLTNNKQVKVISLSATSLFDGSNGQNVAYLIYTD
ncbi:hypothetical protein [Ferruginibacter albus]|uniref:hypothetical protein n=1 Tax=Ferruginibacter albus TaxID=2875540 RepID=UPI001CC3C900|nr:hypothetical protein [Ferruginibacter albus]UAY53132.1 hypothetical protein K9M53_05515 [Ferruginibacter albus]